MPTSPATRVVSVSPEPTPYRAPLFDRLAARPDLELLVVYAARTVAGRSWDVELHHPHVLLRGYSVPGAARVLRHDYPVTPGVVRALQRARPDCVVVSGWSTFTSQAAIAWCRLRRVPYVLLVESHDHDPRPGWRRAVKQLVVPRVVRGAAGVLVTGTLARDSMVRRGARPETIRVFANTVDVRTFGERAAEHAAHSPRLRASLGLGPSDVAVLCVARLGPEKGLDTLVRAAASAGVVPVLVGDGPEGPRLEALAGRLGARLVLPGALAWERIVEAYAGCDVFALLSRSETWGVVVNEAAACGLPLVLSDHVGAAHDLLVEGENGFRVPVDDVPATAAALRRLAGDPELRSRFGARSREIAAGWGYEASVEAFVGAVRDAVA